MNKEKIIKCRVKSDSTFTDLIGYDLLVVRDKAFYRIDDINPELENLDEKSESLFQKYCGFLIGREELEFPKVIDSEGLCAYSPIGKVDTSNPPKTDFTKTNLMKCRVKPNYYNYDDFKDLELLVTPYKNTEGLYRLDNLIWKDSFNGNITYIENNYRVGNIRNPFCIEGKYLDFQIDDKPKESDPVREFESNNTRIYKTGAKRASNRNKPFIHNLQPYTLLRFGYLTNMGAREYGDGNFLKGFPNENAIESLLRHITLFRYGDMSEDHLSSAIFNIQLLILNQEKEGIKPDHWFKYEK